MKVVAIDGRNCVHRAWHANKDLTRSDGVQVGAIYGYYRILRSVVAGNLDRIIIVCWEGGVGRRREIHPGYKYNRHFKKETDPEKIREREAFQQQLPVCHAITDHLGICNLRIDGLEADDLVASLCRANDDVLVVSTDRDFYQLLHFPGIRIDRGSLEDEYVTRETFRITETTRLNGEKCKEVVCSDPLRYRLFHCLNGDDGDEVPGIPGVGKKTVWTFLKDIPDDALMPVDWDWVYFAAKRHRSKRAQKIAENIMAVLRNFDLVDLLETQLMTETQASEARAQLRATPSYELERALQIFQDHEFKSVIDDLHEHLWPFERTCRETQLVRL
jgi:5'-3' exonuclease